MYGVIDRDTCKWQLSVITNIFFIFRNCTLCNIDGKSCLLLITNSFFVNGFKYFDITFPVL